MRKRGRRRSSAHFGVVLERICLSSFFPAFEIRQAIILQHAIGEMHNEG